MKNNERLIAHQTQEKFQFYAVALSFTILGLSIQTATFDGQLVSRICELSAWVCLLISGLAGLSHLEWSPVLRVKMTQRDELQENMDQLQQQKSSGVKEVYVLQEQRAMPIEERITQFESYISTLDALNAKLDRKAEIKYWFFKWPLTAGIVLLGISRSYDPVLRILHELGKT